MFYVNEYSKILTVRKPIYYTHLGLIKIQQVSK